MAPPNSTTLAFDALGENLPAIARDGAMLAPGEHVGKSKLLRLLVRALKRVAEAEKAIDERDELIDRLKSMAMTDPLTGLLNRRGFEEHLRRITASAERHGQGGKGRRQGKRCWRASGHPRLRIHSDGGGTESFLPLP